MTRKLTLILVGLALLGPSQCAGQGGQSTNIRVVNSLPTSCTPNKGSMVMYQDRQYYCDSTGHYVPNDPGKGITDGNGGSAVTTTPYPVACDVNSLPIDRSSTLRLKSGASVVTVPDSTAPGCTGGMTFALLGDGAGTVTVNRSASDTFTILNGYTNVDGATSFTLGNGQYAILSNGATNIWEVRIVAHRTLSCTEAWGGSGTSFALTSGDDAISNNTCYNDSGVTRTITAVKCRSDNASNTTTVNPTFGSAGTGTTILSGALTCGNSLAYSSSGTVSNASWTTGTGINPVMSGTLTGTSIAMIVEFVY